MEIKPKVPPVDLARQYLAIKTEIDDAVQRVLLRGRFILDEETRSFEEEFAAYIGAGQAVGVASGTEAIALALQGLGIGPGDEVITVSHTAVATAAGIELAGARPVFVDIEDSSFTMDARLVENAVTPRSRAILPVHLYGRPADMDAIMAVAKYHHLAVVEDCAQAHGARYKGRLAGSIGDAAAFSFYPTKNLGADGDGGIVVTSSTQIAERVRMLRQYGWKERYISEMRGGNSRLDELQAAILRAKLAHLESWNTRRRQLAGLYTSLLAGTSLTLPSVSPQSQHTFHLYVIRSDARDALLNYLREQNIGAQIHYPVPIHLQPAYGDLGFPAGSLPKSERAAREVLSLPLYPEMTDQTVEYVAEAIKTWLEHG